MEAAFTSTDERVMAHGQCRGCPTKSRLQQQWRGVGGCRRAVSWVKRPPPTPSVFLQAHAAVSASTLVEKEAVISELREANEVIVLIGAIARGGGWLGSE